MPSPRLVEADPPTLPTFPCGALPSPLGEYALALAETLQVPADLPAMLLLSACAAAAQRIAYVEPRPGWVEPLALFTATALPSGDRKSATLAHVLRPHRAYEREHQDSDRAAMKSAEAERRILEREQTRAIEAEDRPEAARIARMLAAPPPSGTRVLADDATGEALGGLLCAHGSIGVFSAEGGIFQRFGGRYTRGMPDIDVYLSGHAGEAMRFDRRGDGERYVEHPALSVGLAVQPSMLSRLATVEGVEDRGLLGRFLFAFPASRVGRRDVDPAPLPESVVHDYDASIRRLLDAATQGRRRLAFSAEARADLITLARSLETRLHPDTGDLLFFSGWGHKLAGAICRIAAIFELVAHGSNASEVRYEAFRRARALVEFLVAHARQAARIMAGDPATALQNPIVAMLVDIAGEDKEWRFGELHAELHKRQLPLRWLPTSARAQRARVDQLASILDALGVDITHPRHRIVRLSLREGAEE